MKLLDQLSLQMRINHHSIRTEKAYRYWVIQYVRFHNLNHPKDLNEQDIRNFISFLAKTKHVAASTQNQALASFYIFTEVF